MGRFVANPAFESQLRRDPDTREVIHEVAEDTAEDANRNIRAMFRPAVMTPFMPKGGYRAAAGRRPVRALRDAEGEYVTNLDHGGHLYEFGSIKTPPLAPLRRAARANARLVETPR